MRVPPQCASYPAHLSCFPLVIRPMTVCSELAPHYSVVKTVQVNNRRKRRREAREEARQAKRQHHQPSTAQPQQQTKPQHEDEKREADERTALIQDIVQGQPTSTQQPNGGLGLTLGLNSTTRTLETCQPTADTTINASPYALLVLTSCFPAALTAHFTYYSHYLRLPLLTLHSSISTQQLAHCLSSQLTSLLVMAVHRGSNASLLESLLPMARVLHIDWLDGQGRYEKLRIDKVERSEERAAKEEAKRKAREDAARAARPLSPKSIAAAVFKQKQKDKEAAEAAAKQASADRTTADSTSDTATVTAT